MSHADHYHGYAHSHQVGNMGMPIPPTISHVPQGETPIVATDKHPILQGTTTTEAD